jgi:hypothetical protein
MANTKENTSLLDNIDALPLALKKFMKYEYLVFYDESKQNEKEVEELKNNKKQIQLRSLFSILLISMYLVNSCTCSCEEGIMGI